MSNLSISNADHTWLRSTNNDMWLNGHGLRSEVCKTDNNSLHCNLASTVSVSNAWDHTGSWILSNVQV